MITLNNKIESLIEKTFKPLRNRMEHIGHLNKSNLYHNSSWTSNGNNMFSGLELHRAIGYFIYGCVI